MLELSFNIRISGRQNPFALFYKDNNDQETEMPSKFEKKKQQKMEIVKRFILS